MIQRLGAILDHVRGVLIAGVRDGTLRPINPLLTHLTLVGTVILVLSARPLRERLAGLDTGADVSNDPDELVDFLVDIVLHGVAFPEAHGGTS